MVLSLTPLLHVSSPNNVMALVCVRERVFLIVGKSTVFTQPITGSYTVLGYVSALIVAEL